MMKHKYIEKLIQRHFDREISPEQERALNEHVAECDDCREFYEQMVNTCIGLETIPDFYPMPGFNDRIMREFGWRTRSVFKPIAAVSSAIWFSTLVAIILFVSPLNIFSSLIKKIPAGLRLMHSVNMVIGMFNHFLQPLFKTTVNPSWIAFGIILCVLTTILLSRIVKKEETCIAS